LSDGTIPVDPAQKMRARRRERYLVRRRLRNVIPQGVSKVFAGCGRKLLRNHVAVTVGDGVAHFAGVAACGAVWICPVCLAKIRHGRAVDLARLFAGAVADGQGVCFLTLTSRHNIDQPLAWLFNGTEQAWAGVQQDRDFRRVMVGHQLRWITVREVTFGVAGWHPHRHIAVISDHELNAPELLDLEERLWVVWRRQLHLVDMTAERGPGVMIRPCTYTDGLGWYLLKVTGADSDPDSGWTVSLEMARSDLKTGRAGGRTPEELVRGWVLDGDTDDADRWLEYARATKRRRMLTMSQGLRGQYLTEPELSDEELANKHVGGQILAELGPGTWNFIERTGLALDALEAAEHGPETLGAWLWQHVSGGDWHLVSVA
jgi:hypothetical protein